MRESLQALFSAINCLAYVAHSHNIEEEVVLVAQMASKGVKFGLVCVVMVLVFGAIVGECAFGIAMNPCTLAQCTAECKKALKEKFMSATCAANSQGKLCICLG